jgi:NAD(P)H-hydrate epimerase
MTEFNPDLLRNLYRPAKDSHKGQNGKLLIIGGSQLFHAASLWALTVASRIVDMVFYSSVETNNRIVESIKAEFRNGIVVPRSKLKNYIKEADCILIGPGLPRKEGQEEGDDDTSELTKRLLHQHPEKRWVVDGGSLQTIDPEVLLSLKTTPILTPHKKELETLFNTKYEIQNTKYLSELAKKYNCVILLKGAADIVTSPNEQVRISGGNPGMTKGGTGDVLAGLVAALYCKNDAFLSACAASYINKRAGESLSQKTGIYFNASDLADAIPIAMKELLL